MAEEYNFGEIRDPSSSGDWRRPLQRPWWKGLSFRLVRCEKLLVVIGCLNLALFPIFEFIPASTGLVFGTLIAHVVLAGVWAALGPLSTRRRVPLATCWLVLLISSLAIRGILWNFFAPWHDVGLQTFVPLVVDLVGTWVLVQLVCWPCRAVFRQYIRRDFIPKRLSHQPPLSSRARLFTLVAIGGLVALVGFLVLVTGSETFPSFFNDQHQRIKDYWVLFLVGSSLSGLGLWASLLPRWQIPAIILAFCCGGIVSIGQHWITWQFVTDPKWVRFHPPYLLDVLWTNGIAMAWAMAFGLLLRLKGYRIQKTALSVPKLNFPAEYRGALAGTLLLLGACLLEGVAQSYLYRSKELADQYLFFVWYGIRGILEIFPIVTAIYFSLVPLRRIGKYLVVGLWFGLITMVFYLHFGFRDKPEVSWVPLANLIVEWSLLSLALALGSLLTGLRLCQLNSQQQYVVRPIPFTPWVEVLLSGAIVALVLGLMYLLTEVNFTSATLDFLLFRATLLLLMFELLLLVLTSLLRRYAVFATVLVVFALGLFTIYEAPWLLYFADSKKQIDSGVIYVTNGIAIILALLFALVLRWSGYRLTWPERQVLPALATTMATTTSSTRNSPEAAAKQIAPKELP